MIFYQDKNFIDGFVKLVEKCNKAILDIYNNDFDVIYKEDESPLTVADKTCNDIICNYLSGLNFHLNMNIGIISEENRNEHYLERKQHNLVWLVENGIPIFGIVSIPVTGEIFVGIKGVGSYKLHDGCRTILKIKTKNFKSKNLNVVASASHINIETQEFISQFDSPNIINTGRSIKLLWVAENKADIYPRIALTSEWDTCAAHAVVKYAGGNVVIHDESKEFNVNSEEVIYNKENLLNPYNYQCLNLKKIKETQITQIKQIKQHKNF